MTRGGARPGAGRKPKDGIAAKRTAKPKGYTAATGERSPEAPKTWPFGQAPQAPAADVAAGQPQATEDTPLDYLLKIMRDPNKSESARMQAAVQAAPYVHPRLTPSAKKESAVEKAKKAGQGRFKATPPPLKLVSR